MNDKVKQALEMIDRALSVVTGTRQDHINLQTALKIVTQELEKSQQEKTEEE